MAQGAVLREKHCDSVKTPWNPVVKKMIIERI